MPEAEGLTYHKMFRHYVYVYSSTTNLQQTYMCMWPCLVFSK